MLKLSLSVFSDLIEFIKKPNDNALYPWINKQYTFIAIVIADIALTLLMQKTTSLVVQAGSVTTSSHKLTPVFSSQQPLAFLVLSGLILCFVIPFVEELIFRLGLRFKYFPVRLLILLIQGENGQSTIAKMHKVWTRHFATIFYGSVFLFAMLHLFNYKIDQHILSWSIVLTFPQIVLGTMAGYLRLRIGFRFGYYLHALHNGFFITFHYLLINY